MTLYCGAEEGQKAHADDACPHRPLDLRFLLTSSLENTGPSQQGLSLPGDGTFFSMEASSPGEAPEITMAASLDTGQIDARDRKPDSARVPARCGVFGAARQTAFLCVVAVY